MGKLRKSGHMGPKPDDYFAAGPFEFARYGKTMVGRSRMAAEQFEKIARLRPNSPWNYYNLGAL